MKITVNKKAITSFMEDKLAAFLVENTTDFSVAAFILQAIENQMRLLEGKDIVISRDELKEMHEDAMLMDALRGGGVDNWEWYSESISDYLKFINEDRGTDYQDFDEAVEGLFIEVYGNETE